MHMMLKFVVPEDGKYKLSYKEENNASRVQLFGSSNEKLRTKFGTVNQQMTDLIMI